MARRFQSVNRAYRTNILRPIYLEGILWLVTGDSTDNFVLWVLYRPLFTYLLSLPAYSNLLGVYKS
jgi:hypothetical protein